VKILLGRDDVNPGIPNIYGSTPLHSAAWNGHEGVVKMLLGRGDIIPDKPDNNGRTPLDLATRRCHVGVAVLLGHPRP
jgi:ankyrin repeat protein